MTLPAFAATTGKPNTIYDILPMTQGKVIMQFVTCLPFCKSGVWLPSCKLKSISQTKQVTAAGWVFLRNYEDIAEEHDLIARSSSRE